MVARFAWQIILCSSSPCSWLHDCVCVSVCGFVCVYVRLFLEIDYPPMQTKCLPHEMAFLDCSSFIELRMCVGADSWTQTGARRGEIGCKTSRINAPAPLGTKREKKNACCAYSHHSVSRYRVRAF